MIANTTKKEVVFLLVFCLINFIFKKDPSVYVVNKFMEKIRIIFEKLICVETIPGIRPSTISIEMRKKDKIKKRSRDSL